MDTAISRKDTQSNSYASYASRASQGHKAMTGQLLEIEDASTMGKSYVDDFEHSSRAVPTAANNLANVRDKTGVSGGLAGSEIAEVTPQGKVAVESATLNRVAIQASCGLIGLVIAHAASDTMFDKSVDGQLTRLGLTRQDGPIELVNAPSLSVYHTASRWA